MDDSQARLREAIIDAINGRRRLQITYKGGDRLVEPYLLYETQAGNHILHGWQIGGAWEKSPPPDWCNLSLKYISLATPLPDCFDEPHPEYNPDSKQFHRVIVATPKGTQATYHCSL